MGGRRRALLTALVLYSILVFILDLFAPLGIEVWVLNMPVFFVPVLFRSTRMVVVASLACTAMVVLGSSLSPPGGNPRYWDVLNRGMGVIAVWLIAGMALNAINRTRQLDEAVRGLQREIARHEQTSRSLELSEERLRVAVEGVGMGTFDLNLETGTVYWSPTHLRMLGYQTMPADGAPADLWRSIVYPDDLPRIEEAREDSLRNRTLFAVEYRIRRADSGEIVWLAVFGRWYYNAAGQGIRFLGVSFDITRRKELERRLLDKTATAERHIGQELHDGAGQELTGLGLMAQTLAQRLPEAGPEQRLAARLVAGLHELHKHIRDLARGLVPVEIETRGLWAALHDLARRTSEQSGVAVRFDCSPSIPMPDHATSMELYRIAQEAVSNALRHGRPGEVRLSILSQADGLRLRIRDDGVGIEGQPKESKGLGIRIMEYRAALIGGVLRVKPAEGGGTDVTVTLPWGKANAYTGSNSNGSAG